MRVLMLAHRLPYPPHTGDKVRAYHVARHLARGHDLTLACLADEEGAPTSVTMLRREVGDIVCVRIQRRSQRLRSIWGLARGGSGTVKYFDSGELRAALQARLRSRPVDLVYVSSSSMAQYVSEFGAVPVVMDFVDVDSDKWRQYSRQLPWPKGWVYRLEARRLRAHELAAARRASRCIVATRREEELLRSFAPWAPTSVIQNGVDLDHFAPAGASATDPVIVFTGAMDYYPNVDAVTWFCHRVFPRIRLEVPAAQFLIVGKNPVRQVRALGALGNVEVTGTVPDVRPFLRRAAVAVAPLRVARGVQNKVLEAMAMGLPVVASPRAHEGIEARPGDHLFVADDPGEFANVVVRLLRTPALRGVAGRSARAFVEANHCWTTSMKELERVVCDVTRSSSSASRVAP
jgi:sugar transferase (PEP-CTERM/EpsH1 system associated)